MWDVAASIVDHGAIDIQRPWPRTCPRGQPAHLFAVADRAVARPRAGRRARGGRACDRAEPRRARHAARDHLAPAALGALGACCSYGLLRDLGTRTRTASLCTAILAGRDGSACTRGLVLGDPPAGLRARSDALDAARCATRRRGRDALWLGAWAGRAFTRSSCSTRVIAPARTRSSRGRWRKRRPKDVAGWSASTGGALLVVALAYTARAGLDLKTGYESSSARTSAAAC